MTTGTMKPAESPKDVLNMPPKSIFDPVEVFEDPEEEPATVPSMDDSETGIWTQSSMGGDSLNTRDTVSTFPNSVASSTPPRTFTRSNNAYSPARRKRHAKHPSQLNEVELRVQLWDAYRLARIILGTPIKSFSLKGKTILHSIQKVAEMKLELIRLQKELEMARVVEAAAKEHPSTKLMSPTGGDLCNKLNMHIAQMIVPPTPKAEPSTPSTPLIDNARPKTAVETPSQQQQQQVQLLEGTETPRRRITQPTSSDQRLQVYETKYEQLQETHNQMMGDFQKQLKIMQKKLAEAQTPATLCCDRKVTVVEDEATTLERHKLQESIEELLKQVQVASDKSQSQYQDLQERLDKFESMPPKPSLDLQPKTLLPNPIEVSSSSDASEPDEEIYNPAPRPPIETQAQFEQRLKTIQTLHTLELESFRSKHYQQIVDLSGQLDTYQHQVERQNIELQKWRKRYNHLEEMAVTPSETRNVLQQMEAINPKSIPDERAKVHSNVMVVLERMTQLQTKQQKEKKALQRTKDAAAKRAAKSQEELDFLKLQQEMLEEDTKVSPEEWKEQLSQQRKAYRRETAAILRQEEQRLIEMEYLEVHLTELSFLAVEIEDLEKHFQENQTKHASELAKAKARMEGTSALVEDLKKRTLDIQKRQKETLESLALQSKRPLPDLARMEQRLNRLNQSQDQQDLLQQKEDELTTTRTALQASQDRVRELEAALSKLDNNSSTLPTKQPGLSISHLEFPTRTAH